MINSTSFKFIIAIVITMAISFYLDNKEEIQDSVTSETVIIGSINIHLPEKLGTRYKVTHNLETEIYNFNPFYVDLNAVDLETMTEFENKHESCFWYKWIKIVYRKTVNQAYIYTCLNKNNYIDVMYY